MIFNIITIFPDVFNCYFKESIIKRAQEKGRIEINFYNPRDYTEDCHRTVDDKPYGGGPGMVMMVEPIYKAVKSVQKKNSGKTKKGRRVVLLSPQGKKLDQKKVCQLAKIDQLTLICGRYEGVDQRVADYIADEEISIGEYILTGGELPAMVVIDAVSRFVPGVINKESLKEESFSGKEDSESVGVKYEYPQYTRPETLVIGGKKRKVPETLLSGDHQAIRKWRSRHSH